MCILRPELPTFLQESLNHVATHVAPVIRARAWTPDTSWCLALVVGHLLPRAPQLIPRARLSFIGGILSNMSTLAGLGGSLWLGLVCFWVFCFVSFFGGGRGKGGCKNKSQYYFNRKRVYGSRGRRVLIQSQLQVCSSQQFVKQRHRTTSRDVVLRPRGVLVVLLFILPLRALCQLPHMDTQAGV